MKIHISLIALISVMAVTSQSVTAMEVDNTQNAARAASQPPVYAMEDEEETLQDGKGSGNKPPKTNPIYKYFQKNPENASPYSGQQEYRIFYLAGENVKDAEAQYAMGKAAYNGHKRIKVRPGQASAISDIVSLPEAIGWFQRAAAQGHRKAQKRLNRLNVDRP